MHRQGNNCGKRGEIRNTTSHICTIREAFTEFHPVEEMINGVGDTGTAVTGRGTVKIKFEFDGKTFIHQLRDTLYVLNAPNCLLSLSQIDDGGGSVDFSDGTCWIKDKGKKIIGKGYKHHRLFMLYARVALPGKEMANYASTEKLTWCYDLVDLHSESRVSHPFVSFP